MIKSNKYLTEIKLGNVNQFIIEEIKDINKPICLFIHGGPGTPLPFGISAHGQFKNIYKYFNPVFWDQRGCGKSYNKNIPKDTINLKQLINDSNELIAYLLKKYNQDKIYLVGHSFGTIITIELAKKYSEKIKKIYNISQIVSMPESNRLTYNKLKEIAKSNNDFTMMKKLNKLNNSNFNTYKDMQIIWSNAPKYLKTISENFGRIMIKACKSKNYSLSDILNNLSPVRKLYFNFFNNLLDLDLLKENLSLDVPIHWYQGKGDYRCPIELLYKLQKHISSPYNNKITILEHSAHNPCSEDIESIFENIEL